MTYVNKASCLFVGIFFPIVGALAVAARFSIRLVRNSPLLLDDWFSLIALVFATGLCGMLAAGATHDTWGSNFEEPKAGKPSTYGTIDRWILLRKLEFAATLLRDPAFGFMKLSILLFYRRIFDHAANRTFHYLNEAMIWLVGLWIIVFFFTGLFQCGVNFWVQWELSGPGAPNPCFERSDWNLAQCVTDAAMDLVILILPLPFVWALHMRTRKKIATTIVFILGAGTVGISVVRVAAQAAFVNHSGILGTSMKNPIPAISVAPFWFAVEAGVGQLVCCLPSLYPAIKRPRRAIAILRSLASFGSVQAGDTHLGGNTHVQVRRWIGLEPRAPAAANEKVAEAGEAGIPPQPSPPVGLSLPTTHLSGPTGTSGLAPTSFSRDTTDSWTASSYPGVSMPSGMSTASASSDVDLVAGTHRFEPLPQVPRVYDPDTSVAVIREVSVTRDYAQ